MKAFFFDHDYGARNDNKVLKLRAKFNNPWGYGLYWMFVESMHETKDGYIDSLALAELKLSFGIAEEELEKFIYFCVEEGLFIKISSNRITTGRVQEHKEFRKERSISGKKGVDIREKRRQARSKTSSASSSASQQHDAIHNITLHNITLHESTLPENNNKPKVKQKDPIPPSLEEVKSYCKERKSSVDYMKWHSYYTSNGWMVGKNKMKDWKAAVRTWERNEQLVTVKDKWNDLN